MIGKTIRHCLLATACGIALPVALTNSALAAKIEGQFSGSARSVGITGVTGSLAVSLKSSKAAGCPCRGTRGTTVQTMTPSIDVPGILSVQPAVATAFGDKTKAAATTSQSSTLTGLSLFGGMVTADALVAEATVGATKTALTKSDAGTTFTNLVVNGTKVDSSVPDNTVMDLPGIGTLTIKAVNAGKNAGEAHEDVTLLVVDVTKNNSLNLPVGAKLTLGRATAGYDRTQPEAILGGGANGLGVNAAAGQELLAAARSAALVGLSGCSGTGGKALTNTASDLNVAGLLSIGNITDTATGAEGHTSTAQTSSTVTGVSLLGGLITVSSIVAAAQESFAGGVATPSTAGSGFTGLSIAGVPIDPGLAANTTLPLVGIGKVVVNEQIVTGSSVHVNGLHIIVTQQNLLGLTPGAQIYIAHASATAKPF